MPGRSTTGSLRRRDHQLPLRRQYAHHDADGHRGAGAFRARWQFCQEPALNWRDQSLAPLHHASCKVWMIGDDVCWMHKRHRRPPLRHQLGGRLLRRGAGGPAPRATRTRLPCSEAMPSSPMSELSPTGGRGGRASTKARRHSIGKANRWVPALALQRTRKRSTVAARQCPSWPPCAEDPAGVPISVIVFGRRTLTTCAFPAWPRVFLESLRWLFLLALF